MINIYERDMKSDNISEGIFAIQCTSASSEENITIRNERHVHKEGIMGDVIS